MIDNMVGKKRDKILRIAIAALLFVVLLTESLFASYGRVSVPTTFGRWLLYWFFFGLQFVRPYNFIFIIYVVPIVALKLKSELQVISRVKVSAYIYVVSFIYLAIQLPFIADNIAYNVFEHKYLIIIVYLLVFTASIVTTYAAIFAYGHTAKQMNKLRISMYLGILLICAILGIHFYQLNSMTWYYKDILFLYALSVLLLLIYYDHTYKLLSLSVFLLPAANVALVHPIVANRSFDISPLDLSYPQFQFSVWHVIFCVTEAVGYAALTTSFGLAMIHVIAVAKQKQTARPLHEGGSPADAVNCRLLRQSIIVGFLLLTMSMASYVMWLQSFTNYGFWGLAAGASGWQVYTWAVYAMLALTSVWWPYKNKLLIWGSITGFFLAMHSFIGYKDFLKGL